MGNKVAGSSDQLRGLAESLVESHEVLVVSAGVVLGHQQDAGDLKLVREVGEVDALSGVVFQIKHSFDLDAGFVGGREAVRGGVLVVVDHGFHHSLVNFTDICAKLEVVRSKVAVDSTDGCGCKQSSCEFHIYYY